MQGLMMDYPLTLQHAYQRATHLFARKEIVTQTEGEPHRYTYADWGKRVAQLANALTHAGAQQGDRIATFGWNTYRHFELYYAIPCIGSVLHTLNIRLFAEQLVYIVNNAEDKIIFVDGDLVPTLEKIADQLSTVKLYVIMGDAPGSTGKLSPSVDYETFIGSQPTTFDWPQLDENAAAAMCYTSGTTGKPKGVKRPLTFAPLGNDPRRVERMRSLFLMDADTIFFTPAPLYHAAPLRFCMTVFRLGGTVVLTEKFDAENALACLGTYRVTHSQWVPTMFVRLLQLPEERSRRLDLSSHRVAIHSGAPCSIALKRRMIDWWGPILHEYYSGTESVGFTHATSEEWLSHPGTVGRPWGCKIHIVGEDHQERGPGEVGTVYFESHVELRYHNEPDKTIKAHHKQGWATMGDIGYVDTDGYLYLTDRKAFTIVSGGVNIYPREIEELLESSPLVKEVCVFGVPDPEYGEAVQAVIQPTSLEQAGPELAHELFAFVRSKLAAYKCPRYLDFRDELPHMENGKLHKQQLQNEYKTRIDRGYTRSQKHKSE
ncbi:MAG: acyl-CoA synthetase [Ktedonobacteraceae bacterium]